MIIKLLNRISTILKNRKNGIKVSLTSNTTNTTFEGYNKIGRKTIISNSIVGMMTYLGPNTNLPNTIIGRYCSIGSYVDLIVGKHPTETFVSTHPAFYSTREQSTFTFVNENKFEEIHYIKTVNNRKFVTEIGNDVWIGSHVKISDGIKIGDGAIIAAGSIVNKDVPPYAIVGGIPAKLIRYRFDNSTIELLKDFRWWNKDVSWLKENSTLFINIDNLIRFNENNNYERDLK